MNFWEIISKIFISVGGTLVTIVLFLKFGKKPFENYIDAKIKLKVDKELENYKQDLKKEYKVFEMYITQKKECIDNIVEMMGTFINDCKGVSKCLNKCLKDRITLEHVLSQAENEQLMIQLENIYQLIEKNQSVYEVYLPKDLSDEVMLLGGRIKVLTSELQCEGKKVVIDEKTYQELLNTSGILCNDGKNLLLRAKEECQDN